jgi:LPS export ABC transporter protein LptC
MKHSHHHFATTVIALAGILFLLQSCETKETAKPVVYNGPLREVDDVEMLYTEKDLLKIKLKGKKFLEYESGDREFPEGIYMEFYDEAGNIASTLKANHAYFFKAEYKWRGRGNVEVRNLTSQEQLNTEELFWKPDTKRITSEKFVTIRQQNDIIYGTGLDAAQDLSDYTITRPTGDFEMKEN